jgi:ubiquinone/menaquinone biosynthesis C-methylase UbiE
MIDEVHTDTARISEEFERRGREIPRDFYSWSRPANLLQDQSVVRTCIRLLHRAGMFPLENMRVADIGCGSGSWLLEFIQWGASPDLAAGIDLMPDRLERARRKLPQVDLRLGNAAALPWDSGTFDLLSQFVVFTSILEDGLKKAAAQEMLRVLKPL